MSGDVQVRFCERPGVRFPRATHLVAHCRTEEQAKQVLESIKRRLERCRLEVHPGKTQIVYCKDDDRGGGHPNEKFNFLGYTFRPRRSKNRWGKFFINFSPAVSNEAAKKMRQEMRRWHINLRSDKAINCSRSRLMSLSAQDPCRSTDRMISRRSGKALAGEEGSCAGWQGARVRGPAGPRRAAQPCSGS